MQSRVLISLITALFYSSIAFGQVPIVYYDFESNTDRNATVQLTPAASIAVLGNSNIAATNHSITTTSVSNSGNGVSYGGSNSGFALSRSGFTTNASSTSTDNSLDFASFNCVGFSNLTVQLDAMKADANAAQNIDIYWSTDNLTYTKATFSNNSVSTSYATKTYTLGAGANSTSTLYIKIKFSESIFTSLNVNFCVLKTMFFRT